MLFSLPCIRHVIPVIWSPGIYYDLSQNDVARQLKATFCIMYFRFKIKCSNVTQGGHTFQSILIISVKWKGFVTIGPMISPVKRTGLIIDSINHCREVRFGTHREVWVGTRESVETDHLAEPRPVVGFPVAPSNHFLPYLSSDRISGKTMQFLPLLVATGTACGRAASHVDSPHEEPTHADHWR